MTIDLYYMVESPPCRTVLMVAKHLNIDLNLKNIDLTKGEQLNDPFVQMNPCHCVPTLVDNGFVVWESRAIITYLINSYKPLHPLYPTDPKTRATIDKLLNFDLGTLYKSISSYATPLFFGGNLDQMDDKKLKEILHLFDSMLNNNRFVCGNNLSLADISIVTGFSLLEAMDYELNHWINICKWIQNVKQELIEYFDEINAKAIQNTRQYIQYLKRKDNQKLSE